MMIVNEELKKAYEGIEDDLELVEYEGFYNHIKEWNFIKNYITNLQQENAQLKDKIKKQLINQNIIIVAKHFGMFQQMQLQKII